MLNSLRGGIIQNYFTLILPKLHGARHQLTIQLLRGAHIRTGVMNRVNP
jgi:hypothetical protein